MIARLLNLDKPERCSTLPWCC